MVRRAQPLDDRAHKIVVAQASRGSPLNDGAKRRVGRVDFAVVEPVADDVIVAAVAAHSATIHRTLSRGRVRGARVSPLARTAVICEAPLR